jgi:glycosyltransferase involved in cell wall biosynthesis
MKKILFIAYYFPPLGGAGVQRSLKYVKYLPDFGYEPVVVSSKGISGNQFDNKMVSDIKEGTKVFYYPAYSPLNLRKNIKNKFLIKFINLIHRLMIPDGLFFWYFFNRSKVLKLIKEEKIDILYTTSAPVSVHLFGLYLKKKIKNLTWISDFRDEWANNPEKYKFKFSFENNPVKNFFDKYYEKQVVKKSQKITSVSNYIENNFKESYKKFSEKFETITNGYDEKDFAGIENISVKEDFEVLYFGSLYGTRHSFYFLDAFSLFYNSLSDKKNVKLRFIGNIDRLHDFQTYCDDKKINEVIKIDKYMDHESLLKEAGKASVLLLLIGNGRGQEGVFTGKIFEYLRLNVPILAMVPLSGVAADLVKRTSSGVAVDFSDVTGITSELTNFYKKWKAGILFSEYNENKKWQIIELFERKKLSERLSLIIDSVTK